MDEHQRGAHARKLRCADGLLEAVILGFARFWCKRRMFWVLQGRVHWRKQAFLLRTFCVATESDLQRSAWVHYLATALGHSKILQARFSTHFFFFFGSRLGFTTQRHGDDSAGIVQLISAGLD